MKIKVKIFLGKNIKKKIYKSNCFSTLINRGNLIPRIFSNFAISRLVGFSFPDSHLLYTILETPIVFAKSSCFRDLVFLACIIDFDKLDGALSS